MVMFLMRTTIQSSKQIMACGRHGRSSLSSMFRPFQTTDIMHARERNLHSSGIVCMGRRSAKIATRKTKADAAKAKLYGKLGKLIAQAVRAGGPDPVANSQLRDALAQAKLAQLPADIIDRNLKKAADKNASDFNETVYECYGPGGTGFIIEALTDNVNRTAAEVRTAITKGGGKIADGGSVTFNFNRVGIVMLDAGAEEEERVFEIALDGGASDVQVVEDDEGVSGIKVITDVNDFAKVSNLLRDNGFEIDVGSSGLGYVPLAEVDVSDEDLAANEALLERLLDVDDVDNVYSNFT